MPSFLHSALSELSFLPIRNGDFQAAKQYVLSAIRIVSLNCQISFLIDLKRQHLFFKSLYTLRLPNFTANSVESKNTRYISDYRNHCLRLMISQKYTDLNVAKRTNFSSKDRLQCISSRDLRAINRIKDVYCNLTRAD